MKSVFSIAFVLVIGLMLSACGPQGPRGLDGAPGAPGAPAPTPTPTPVVDEVQEEIDALLKEENDYRLYLGQTALTAGLSCSVQAVASGQWLSSGSPGYNAGQGVVTGTGTTYTYLYKGWFNQADTSGANPNGLLPEALRPMFVNKNLVIRCSGQIVVLETGYYDFDLSSDDGSILTVDGTQVINNDGNHGMTQKLGTKFLRRGVRSFSLSYAQTGSGNFGLILKAGGSNIDPKHYAH